MASIVTNATLRTSRSGKPWIRATRPRQFRVPGTDGDAQVEICVQRRGELTQRHGCFHQWVISLAMDSPRGNAALHLMSEGGPDLRDDEWPAIRRLVVSYVSVFRLSYDDSEDVVQRAMMRIWRGWHSFDGRSRRSSWGYRVVRNECLTWRRTKHSRTPVSESPPRCPQCLRAKSIRFRASHSSGDSTSSMKLIGLLCCYASSTI